MSRKSENVKKWRRRTKVRVIESMGGKCVCCGYKKCADAMHLHHLNPEEKETGVSYWYRNPHSWHKIVAELQKCILVCSNCHSEIHAGVTKVPEKPTRFNEEYNEYRVESKECERCGTDIPGSYSSNMCRNCSSKESLGGHAYKVEWDKINLENMLEKKSYAEIAKELDVSRSAIEKRVAKMNIDGAKYARMRREKVKWDTINLEDLMKNNSLKAIGRMLGISDNGVRKRARKIGLL